MNGRFLYVWKPALAIVTVAAIAVAAIMATGCANSSASATNAGTTVKTKAAKAPDFNADSLEGGTLSLADLVKAGKPMLITFGASW